jgi:hypothetical protein
MMFSPSPIEWCETFRFGMAQLGSAWRNAPSACS